MAALDDEEVAALNLRHDPAEDLMDKRVKRWVSNDIVGDVDK